MLLQDSRRAARLDAAGELVLLADQDRSLWDRSAINEARAILARVLAGHEYGAYTIQAAIAAEHARAATAEATDWGRIVELYNLLRVADPSPVVDLNRAAAVGLRDGPAAGIALIDAALEQGGLAGYAPAYTARAELHRRLGDAAAARSDYNVALGLLGDGPERRLVARRLRDLGPAP
jgi:RNA polymerase sigma-70 factor (ECF subfamily)